MNHRKHTFISLTHKVRSLSFQFLAKLQEKSCFSIAKKFCKIHLILPFVTYRLIIVKTSKNISHSSVPLVKKYKKGLGPNYIPHLPNYAYILCRIYEKSI